MAPTCKRNPNARKPKDLSESVLHELAETRIARHARGIVLHNLCRSPAMPPELWRQVIAELERDERRKRFEAARASLEVHCERDEVSELGRTVILNSYFDMLTGTSPFRLLAHGRLAPRDLG